MALAERAELVARLSLKDDFSGKLRGVEGRMRSLGSAASRTGKAISIGLGAGLAMGAAVTVRAVRSGLDSLAELEDATTSVDAAIKQMGLTGKVTSGQIAQWANEIEASVGAAFDDKAITQAATSLIRYGKVTQTNLRPALVVMTDLAAKVGSVEGASTLLAKALADPAKAAGKLARQGVILTKVEQDQIKALTDVGDVTGAQTVLLDALTKATKGAAAASQGPYQRSISMLHDAWEDATRALAVGFLPVLEEVRDILTQELAKESTLKRIREFGQGLAGGLRGLVSAVRSVDWDAVGGSLKLAGQGAKAVYDAFMGMPDWVKTAVLTGWGLNKLSGGALGGALGSGIEVGLKGVFGQFFARGASPANPMWVQSLGGGVGGVPGGPGGGLLGTVAKVALPVAIVAVTSQAVLALGEALNPPGSRPSDLAGSINGRRGDTGGGALRTGTGAGKAEDDLAVSKSIAAKLDAQRDNIEAMRIALVSKIGGTTDAVTSSKTHLAGKIADDKAAVVSAIRNNRAIVNVRVNTSVSVGAVAHKMHVRNTFTASHTGGGGNSGHGAMAEGAGS